MSSGFERILGVVEADASGVGGLEALGLPLAVWAAARLACVLGEERVEIATRDASLAERAAGLGVRTTEESAHEAGVVAMGCERPFVGDEAIRRATDEAASASSRTTVTPQEGDALEGVVVRGEGDIALVEALARGLPGGDARIGGVAEVGLRWLLARRGPIEAVVTDVDGVLTDGSITLSSDGHESRDFFVRDGLGVGLLGGAGVKHALLSATLAGGSIERRAAMLGIEFVDHGEGDKGPRLDALCARMGVAPERCVYIGDDRNDIPALARAGVGICPFDAHRTAREAADWTLRSRGGRGAFREVVDALLHVIDERPLLAGLQGDTGGSGA